MSANHEITLRSRAWFGDHNLTLKCPENWDIRVYRMKDAGPVGEDEIENALSNPIGTRSLSDLAKEKESAVIIVDDLSRATPANLVIPYILEALKQSGIEDESIRFVIGGGAHRPLTSEEMGKKIGEEVAKKYEVHNHNVFSGTLRALGNLEDGTPVYLNDIVAASDLKIAISGVVPHGGAGFGGGAKLILPGVVGAVTIAYNHGSGAYKGRGRGNIERQDEEKDMRDHMEDVARYVGLDFSVNLVLNSERGIAGIYAGDFIEAHRAAAGLAKEVYETDMPKGEMENTDIAVINAYPLDAASEQLGKSSWPQGIFENAHKVMIDPALDGVCYHGLYGDYRVDFETFLKLKTKEPKVERKPEINAKDGLVLLTESFPVADFYKKYPEGALFNRWENLAGQLQEIYPTSRKVRVAVIPCSPIQLPNTK